MKLHEISFQAYIVYIRNMQSELNYSSDFDMTRLKLHNNAPTTNSPFVPPSNLAQLPDKELELMETSFQENMGEDHSTAIWNATLNYLRNTLNSKFDPQKGINDFSIFQQGMEFRDSMFIQADYYDLVSKNTILSFNQKTQLISGLKNKKNLKLLLERVSEKFCEEIMEEIIYVIYEIWQKYLTFKASTKLNEQLCKLLSPSFTTIDTDRESMREPQTYYMENEEPVIILKAMQAGGEIAASLFVSTKLRYLNLKQAEIKNNEGSVRSQFEILVQVIGKAVYLCCEGCFHHPDGEQWAYGETQLQRDIISFYERELDQQYDRSQPRKRMSI